MTFHTAVFVTVEMYERKACRLEEPQLLKGTEKTVHSDDSTLEWDVKYR